MRGIQNSLFVVLLWSLGIHAAVISDFPKAFKVGETYTYQYSSQVLVGLPKTSAQYTGLQINSLVEFSLISNKVVMTLKNPELLETVKPLLTRKPYELGNKNDFKMFKGPEPEKMKKLLLPVSFKWNLKDKIKSFQVDPSDHPLSINIKRGILNMINLKLNLNSDEWKKDGGIYVISEDEGIDGVCLATYVWSSYPYSLPKVDMKTERALSLTRMKSANKCKVPIGEHVSNFMFTKSGYQKNDFNRTLVKNSNEASINFTISKSNAFFVWEASARSTYALETKKVSQESVNTIVIQTLKYQKSGKNTVNPNAKMNAASLFMDLTKPDVVLTDKDIEKIIELVQRNSEFGVSELPELLPLLRQANQKQIDTITTRVKALAKTKPAVLSPYLDALSQTLTFAASKSLIEEFVLKPESNQKDDREMAVRVGSLAGLNPVKDTKLIDLLTKAASNNVLLEGKNRINTLKTIWLTIGALAGTHYSRNPKYDIKSSVKYFTKIVKATNADMSDETKDVVILKALGNIGMTECLSYLKETMTDKSKPLALRVQSIYSLRKIPRKGLKIVQVLLNIYNDVNEDVELRLAAFVDIMLRSKSRSVMNLIASRLGREPIKQVRAFAQDLIYQLSTVPYMSSTYKPLLRKLVMEDFSREYSKIYKIPVRSGALLVSIIYSPESNIPRTANAIFYDYRFGKRINPFEFGFRFDNRKSSIFESYESMKDYLKTILKSQTSSKKDEPPTMTTFFKRYDNEITYTTIDDEVRKTLNLETLSDVMMYMKGMKPIEIRMVRKIIASGEASSPTTMGLKYSGRVHRISDIRMSLNYSKTFNTVYVKEVKKTVATRKLEMKPYVFMEGIFDYGIDTGYLRTGITSKVHFSTPNPMRLTITVDDEKQNLTLGFKKRSKDTHLFQFRLEKKFKVTRYNKLSEASGVSQYYDLNPFYVSKKELRKAKNETYPFPFGMELKTSYFKDTGKPMSEGVDISMISAGDAAWDVWIRKGNKESEFDEFRIDLRKQMFHSTKKCVLTANHIKNGGVEVKFELMSLNLVFGKQSRVEFTWPYKKKYIEDAMNVLSKKSKIPEMKYMKLSGTMNMPAPLKFDVKEPLNVLRYKKEYSYIINSKITNPKGEVVMENEIVFGMDKEAKELGKAVSKNLEKYAAHSDLIAQCAKDIAEKHPYSPSCYNAWLKLNSFNKFSVSMNWTTEGFSRFKRLYNKLNRRVDFAQYLMSEKMDEKNSSYKLVTSISPFFLPAAMTSISNSYITDMYKRLIYPRTSMRYRIFQGMGKKSMMWRENKKCQVRLGKDNVALIKTFDGFYYNIDNFFPKFENDQYKKMILMQDDNNTVQVSRIFSQSDTIIQIMAAGLPIMRIVRTKDKVHFTVDNVIKNEPTIKMGDSVLAKLTTLTKNLYSDKPVYEIDVKKHDFKVVTDMVGMLNIEAGQTYRDSVRGPCGDMNGEFFNEFKNLDCTAAFASPTALFAKNDFKQTLSSLSTESLTKSFLKIKVCPTYSKLQLI